MPLSGSHRAAHPNSQSDSCLRPVAVNPKFTLYDTFIPKWTWNTLTTYLTFIMYNCLIKFTYLTTEFWKYMEAHKNKPLKAILPESGVYLFYLMTQRNVYAEVLFSMFLQPSNKKNTESKHLTLSQTVFTAHYVSIFRWGDQLPTKNVPRLLQTQCRTKLKPKLCFTVSFRDKSVYHSCD